MHKTRSGVFNNLNSRTYSRDLSMLGSVVNQRIYYLIGVYAANMNPSACLHMQNQAPCDFKILCV